MNEAISSPASSSSISGDAAYTILSERLGHTRVYWARCTNNVLNHTNGLSRAGGKQSPSNWRPRNQRAADQHGRPPDRMGGLRLTRRRGELPPENSLEARPLDNSLGSEPGFRARRAGGQSRSLDRGFGLRGSWTSLKIWCCGPTRSEGSFNQAYLRP